MNNKFTGLLIIVLQLVCISCTSISPEQDNQLDSNLSPDVRYGELFQQVQMSGIYSDSKTFADASSKYSTTHIMSQYREQKSMPGFQLQQFVNEHFYLPPNIASDFISDKTHTARQHIQSLWPVLTREPDKMTQGSLIPLPYNYVVPGGRFREIYYWDSYFTMLGLQESGHWNLIEDMVDNFSYLIDTLGFIPNGNRTYYKTRSQPPFYALMVKLLEQKQGAGTLTRYRRYLLKEYEFWMNGADKLTVESPSYRRVVRLPNGALLNRYWDDANTPRPESYKEDVELVNRTGNSGDTFRHIRAAAESGWDFSSRWFKDGKRLETIHTTDLIPIDLNALLYYLEQVLAEAFTETGDMAQAQKFRQRAQQRQQALIRYCWDNDSGFFHDYDFVNKTQTDTISLAALYPLFFHMVDAHQAGLVAQKIQQEFLKPGGVTSTLRDTGQQWDAPNGWAPLQWVTIQGLRNYQHDLLANTIKSRWIELNKNVYLRSGKMVEKYNVYQLGLEGGGGEYPVQDGFGWTNGVLLKLLMETQRMPDPNRARASANVDVNAE